MIFTDGKSQYHPGIKCLNLEKAIRTQSKYQECSLCNSTSVLKLMEIWKTKEAKNNQSILKKKTLGYYTVVINTA